MREMACLLRMHQNPNKKNKTFPKDLNLLRDKTILLNVEPNMMKKLANTFDAQELFKVLPKKMSFRDVQRLRAAVGEGHTKVDNTFVLNKVTGMAFDGNPCPPEAPEPDTKLLPMKADSREPVPPAQIYLDKKEWIYKPDKANKFKFLRLTNKPDSATGMLDGNGNVKTPHVDAEGTFNPIDVTYKFLKAAFDVAFSKKQMMKVGCRLKPKSTSKSVHEGVKAVT
jgi:hypothetical protein